MNRKRTPNRSETVNHQTVSTAEEPINNIRVIREYVEALVIALALAFFFKAFAAEAFVIPTGSMATTLMGRHKDVNCEQCRYPFQINASEESGDAVERIAVGEVLGGTCPQCRHTMYVGRDHVDKKTFLSFNGDRIFVNKSQFDFRDPARWHVTVFRYPGKPQVNYIKRLVGVENETVLLRNGNVFVKKEGEEEFVIQRKPLRAMLSMLRPVDDNDYVNPKLHETGWPTRWFGEDDKVWKRSEDYKSFETAKSQGGWLNFRNIVPSSDDWYYLSQNTMPPTGATNNPQLITDFLGYNSEIVRYSERFVSNDTLIGMREINMGDRTRKEHFCQKSVKGMGFNWVGDLTVECRVNVRQPEGTFTLRLIKGGTVFLCDIDLNNGRAKLSIPDVPEFQTPIAQTPIRGSGTYDIMFCNIDEELRLVVDGREIDFDGQGRYNHLCRPGTSLARDRSPTPRDLTPVGLGAWEADLKVEQLRVFRDMYYIACDALKDSQCDLIESPFRNEYPLLENTVARILSSPEYWNKFGKTNSVMFQLGKNEFLMLGDNSAKSKDSRLWTTDGIPSYVPRELLIGEAVFVYWPHGLRIPGTRIALIPNLRKMRFID